MLRWVVPTEHVQVRPLDLTTKRTGVDEQMDVGSA
jgi:hypothetical protein